MSRNLCSIVLLFLAVLLLCPISGATPTKWRRSKSKILATCRCRPIKIDPSSKCFIFTNRLARTCTSRRCKPTYICDKARGKSICRWKVFKTRIVKDGGNTCVRKKEIMKKLIPVRKVPTYRPRLLKFRGARGSRAVRGLPRSVFIRPHECLALAASRSSFWAGALTQRAAIDRLVLTIRRGHWIRVSKLRVYAGGRLCKLVTRMTRRSTRALYTCYRRAASVIYVRALSGAAIEFCGIDAYGVTHRKTVTPRPKPTPRVQLRRVKWMKALWSGHPGSQALVITRLPHHLKRSWNAARCIRGSRRGGVWTGWFTKAEKVKYVILTGFQGNLQWRIQMKAVKVKVGWKQCRLVTRVLSSATRFLYDCGNVLGAHVEVLAHPKFRLTLCGVDAFSTSR